jgi:BMFP domain-containing protein YqiC
MELEFKAERARIAELIKIQTEAREERQEIEAKIRDALGKAFLKLPAS